MIKSLLENSTSKTKHSQPEKDPGESSGLYKQEGKDELHSKQHHNNHETANRLQEILTMQVQIQPYVAKIAQINAENETLLKFRKKNNSLIFRACPSHKKKDKP